MPTTISQGKRVDTSVAAKKKRLLEAKRKADVKRAKKKAREKASIGKPTKKPVSPGSKVKTKSSKKAEKRKQILRKRKLALVDKSTRSRKVNA